MNTQISTPIVGKNGTTQFNITAGTRAGTNLFHSFGQFDVPVANVANFLNDSGLATSNILGRVTGGNPSNILGTIQTTGFGAANLFLMNPAGIVFGPSASLNVGGSVSFTTADYLRLSDGARFNALPGPQDASLSSAPVAAFGFLGSNPEAITVQGSHLTVQGGQSFSFIGGDIDMSSGMSQPTRISAQGGHINIASVASPGEISYPNLESAPNLNRTGFNSMGSIVLSGGTALDVSANAAGTVKIRGGQLVIEKGTISADTMDANGAAMAVDISTAQSISLLAVDAPALTARTTGSGNAGQIRLVTGNMEITAANEDALSVIDSHTSGTGKGGDIRITTKDFKMAGDPVGLIFPVNSGTTGKGSGGNISIAAKDMTMEDVFLVAGDPLLGPEEASGSAGNIHIQAETMRIVTGSIEAVTFTGKGGDISIVARDLHMENSFISSSSFENQGGEVSINSGKMLLINSSVDSSTVALPGGGIRVTGEVVELRNGSQLLTSTLGDGDAGPINVMASSEVSLSTPTFFSRPSGFFSNSLGSDGILGNAGDIVISTPRLDITGGARINSATQSGGRGGDVIINAESISISGQISRPPTEALFSLGNTLASGIFTATVGTSSSCSGPCGEGGNISIMTSTMTMGNGSQIDSGTRSTGHGGNVIVNARDSISLSGTLNDSTPVGVFSRTVGTAPGSGDGGNITLTAGQSVSLSNGAEISASSSGAGDAGNIQINAGSQFLSNNGSVTTQSSQLNGGNITVQATDSIRLVNSRINTSVEGGPATVGGNITIDPTIMTLQNSQILAQATEGSGGNINITAGTFLADQTSLVDARSQWGLSGTVNIQSPVSSLSGSLATLPQRPLQVQNLLSQRCAAQAGGRLSSLVVAGRERLPAEPGGWLLSPMTVIADGGVPSPARQVTKMSAEDSRQATGNAEPLSAQPGPLPRQDMSSWTASCGS